jgi:hypothetical protein
MKVLFLKADAAEGFFALSSRVMFSTASLPRSTRRSALGPYMGNMLTSFTDGKTEAECVYDASPPGIRRRATGLGDGAVTYYAFDELDPLRPAEAMSGQAVLDTPLQLLRTHCPKRIRFLVQVLSLLAFASSLLFPVPEDFRHEGSHQPCLECRGDGQPSTRPRPGCPLT